MENNLEEKLKALTNRFTPEFLDQLAHDCYDDDRAYPENFSNWYPYIKNFGKFKSTNLISNQIFTFEEVKIMQKYDNIKDVNWNDILEILKPTLEKMEFGKLYNIKNGCFSNKFDFQTCITDKMHLAENLWKINYQSALFETGGNTELVVREYLPYNAAEIPTIYNGMPLREELRVFYNIDKKQIEYIVDYWDYDYCYSNLHNKTDKIIFNWFHNKILGRKSLHNQILQDMTKQIFANINTLELEGLSGIWSIDFMLYNNDIYLIDMARGFRSAYWDIDKINKEII